MAQSDDNYWISLSDLMTGLMVIFMFIAITFLQSEEEKRVVFEEFGKTQNALYKDLQSEFAKDLSKWNMSISEDDLSIKFANPEILFSTGNSDLKPEFKSILDQFLPRYFNVLLKQKYRQNIIEVRIEGHSDDQKYRYRNYDSYMSNLALSQERSFAVLNYYRNSRHYQRLSNKHKRYLQYWLTVNGLSYGRMLDRNNNVITPESNRIADKNISRRVEFRIITNSKSIIDNYNKNN
jgi:outer membrane protein OmpA-like peptidoglycan-associated protein